MEYSLAFATAEGDMMVLLSSQIHPQLFPALALKVSALQEFIPNLRLVTLDHEVTTLVFEHRNVRLQGEKARFFQGFDAEPRGGG